MRWFIALGGVGIALSGCHTPQANDADPAATPTPAPEVPPLPPDWGTVVSDAQVVFMQPLTGSDPAPGPQANPGGYELVIMNLDGTGRRQLSFNNEQEFLPSFSPAGTQLVFTRFLTGGYGIAGSISRVAVFDFATGTTRDLTVTGYDAYPVWSPDGQRIAFLSRRHDPGGVAYALWVMNSDGSSATEIGRPSGAVEDHDWGDIAWSRDDWILFTVGQFNAGGDCFKVRLDKIRPNGSSRTRVTDGGPHCTPAGREQCGDSDPCFSPDGQVVYSSRGLPGSPPGFADATTRRLVALSSAEWTPGKPEHELTAPGIADGIEGVPKASPDGNRLLLFRAAAGERPGIYLTDVAGSYRQWVGEGFAPAWNPAAK